MESLGQILQRMSPIPGSPRKLDSTNSGPNNGPTVVALPRCPKCLGSGIMCTNAFWPDGKRGRQRQYEFEDCTCEIGQSKVGLRRKAMFTAANLPRSDPPQRFDTFKLVPGAEAAFLMAKTYAENLHDKPILVLTGVPGCGKTHLLEAVGRRVLDRGISVRYTIGASLLDELRATYDRDRRENLDDPESPPSFQDVFDRYNNAGLLILDDPGAEAATPWAMEKLYTLINNRFKEMRPLAVGTNLNFRTMRQHLGSRTADRVWDTGSGLVAMGVITAGSYRTGR